MRFIIVEENFKTADVYFQSGFPKEIKKKILQDLKNRKYSEACKNESLYWAKKIESYGVSPNDIEIHDGFFNREGHTWITVSDFIFDPTKNQFKHFKFAPEDDVEYEELDIMSLKDNLEMYRKPSDEGLIKYPPWKKGDKVIMDRGKHLYFGTVIRAFKDKYNAHSFQQEHVKIEIRMGNKKEIITAHRDIEPSYENAYYSEDENRKPHIFHLKK